jgi:putative mRNA 3-end processing factor
LNVRIAEVPLIKVVERGLYCEEGNFFIDPWGGVDLALITHAHADHARAGSSRYMASRWTEPFLKKRMGNGISVETVSYGEKKKIGDTWVSFHPAGHVLGSAQIRIEHRDEVCVVSGDFKRMPDPSCEPFEVVPCLSFITEATFGLPVYSWPPGREVAREILKWWQSYSEGPSLLFCYALGKTQRVLAELVGLTDRSAYLHGAPAAMTEIYRKAGIKMLDTFPVSEKEKAYDFRGELVIAPPSAHRSLWMKRFENPQTAFVSGWMQVRGSRRRMGYERGFVLSDHADWSGLVRTARETEAENVFVSHGHTEVLARYLKEELNRNACPLSTLFEGEREID